MNLGIRSPQAEGAIVLATLTSRSRNLSEEKKDKEELAAEKKGTKGSVANVLLGAKGPGNLAPVLPKNLDNSASQSCYETNILFCVLCG
jgi:hypothetical protein